MSKDLDDFISIHAPVKGATIGLICECGSIHNFNPRSREGSDMLPHFKLPVRGISIHAPVKGATIGLICECGSIHNFNPRSREGSDMLPHFKLPVRGISIHAPVKGATFIHPCVQREQP